MKTRIVKCDLCGKDDSEVIWNKTSRLKDKLLMGKVIKDKDGNIIHGTNVVCKNCGLVYIREQMLPNELDNFYKNEYRNLYGDSSKATNVHADNSIMLFGQLYDKYKIKNLLDIGCYTGEFVNRVNKNTSVDAQGIDFDTQGNRDLIQGDFMNYKFDTKFDCITLFNSLEHMLSPTETLERIHGLLSDNGYVMLSVPNLINLTLSTLPDAFLSNAHTYTFTFKTLDKLLKKVGFNIINSVNLKESIGSKLYVFAKKSSPNEIIYKEDVCVDTYKMYFESMDCYIKCLLKIQGGQRTHENNS